MLCVLDLRVRGERGIGVKNGGRGKGKCFPSTTFEKALMRKLYRYDYKYSYP